MDCSATVYPASVKAHSKLQKTKTVFITLYILNEWSFWMIFWILSVFWQTNWCINTYFIILWLTFYVIEVNLLVSIWIFGTKVNFKPPITQFEPLSCPNWFAFELVKSIPLCCWCYFLWFHRVISYFIDLWEKFLFKRNCLYLFWCP